MALGWQASCWTVLRCARPAGKLFRVLAGLSILVPALTTALDPSTAPPGESHIPNFLRSTSTDATISQLDPHAPRPPAPSLEHRLAAVLGVQAPLRGAGSPSSVAEEASRPPAPLDGAESPSSAAEEASRPPAPSLPAALGGQGPLRGSEPQRDVAEELLPPPASPAYIPGGESQQPSPSSQLPRPRFGRSATAARRALAEARQRQYWDVVFARKARQVRNGTAHKAQASKRAVPQSADASAAIRRALAARRHQQHMQAVVSRFARRAEAALFAAERAVVAERARIAERAEAERARAVERAEIERVQAAEIAQAVRTSRAGAVSRRTAALSVGTAQGVSLRWAGNVAAVQLEDSKVVVALQDFGRDMKGVASLCEVTSGSLTCGAPVLFTSAPIHHDERSLAVAAVWSTQVLFAWKQGSSPLSGHLQICLADISDCGTEVTIPNEWGSVAVATLSRSYVVVAFSDVQRGHRGALALCSVASMNLNCGLEHIFDAGPTNALSVAPLSDNDFDYATQTDELIVAYEAGSGAMREGKLQPCAVVDGSLVCHARSTISFTHGPSAGAVAMGLSTRSFLVGYADLHQSCYPGGASNTRRRALHVCTVDDGHPSIGRAVFCRATFTGLGLARPVLECGDDVVIDDGYGTGAPSLVRGVGAVSIYVAYACEGCADEGPRALARRCAVPALSLTMGVPPGSLTCEDTLLVNGVASRFVSAAALSTGFAVAYDSYGNRGYGNVRLIS
mmetsp:Transcript_77446/g.141736  ORF Transcript_77446/g.141736 Transcript_77446/m.141736 type:complete len:738 (+) Transcript_77446:64-2277(+)